MNGRLLRALAAMHGTPLVVYDLERVRSNLRRLTDAFARVPSTRTRMLYAFKACYLPSVADAVHAAGWGLEVMSGFELERIALLGASPGTPTLTGLGWGPQTVEAAVDFPVRCAVVDTIDDAVALGRRAHASGTTVSVLTRLNVAAELSGEGFLAVGGKLGHDPTHLPGFIDRVRQIDGLHFRGLHVHQSNRLVSTDAWAAILDAVRRGIERTRSAGHEVTELDLGGGFESLSHLDRVGTPIERFAEILQERLCDLTADTGLTLELGRSVVGDAASVLSQVNALKTQESTTTVVLDASTNTLIPVTGARYPVAPLDDHDGPGVEAVVYTDGTGSPVSFDTQHRARAPRLGDLVVLREAGAYTTVFSELWAAALPTVLVIDGERVLARQGAELTEATWDAWYGRMDEVPPPDTVQLT